MPCSSVPPRGYARQDSTQPPTPPLLGLLPRWVAAQFGPPVLAALRAGGALNARLRRAEGPELRVSVAGR